MKVKDLSVQIKAGPADGLAEGQFQAYASVFGNEDSYGDVVIPGAFTETLAEWQDSGNPIPLLWGHNLADPDFNIGHVVSAVEDDHGLLVTGQFDLASPKAAQSYRLVKGKRVNQMSFAYDVLDGGAMKTTTPEGGESSYYELRKLKLYEVSVVPIGANQETEILVVKSAAAALIGGIEAGRDFSAKNESELRKAYEAIGNVLAALEPQDQEKASGTGPAEYEEPMGAKSIEPSRSPSVDTWAAQIHLHERYSDVP